MSDLTYVVTQTRSGGMTVEVEEFYSPEAAAGFLNGLLKTYSRMEGYRAWLTREAGRVVMHAESTVPEGSATVKAMSRYEIVERVA